MSARVEQTGFDKFQRWDSSLDGISIVLNEVQLK